MARRQKAGTEVKIGDIIEIGFGSKSVKVEVLNIQETVKRMMQRN